VGSGLIVFIKIKFNNKKSAFDY